MLVVLSERRSAKVPLSSLFEFQAEKKNAFLQGRSQRLTERERGYTAALLSLT